MFCGPTALAGSLPHYATHHKVTYAYAHSTSNNSKMVQDTAVVTTADQQTDEK